MVFPVNKISSFSIIFFLLASVALPCINACGSCKPIPKPKCSPPAGAPAKAPVAHCPKDTLKLGVCADLLGLVNVVVGEPPSGSKCCALIQGLADVEAASCLCTAIKANVLGINLDVPVALSVLLSACKKTVPSDFTCA